MMTSRASLSPLIALLTSATLWACSGQTSEAPTADVDAGPLPLMIQGMLRVDVMAGQVAADMLGRMHGEEVAPTESYVGRYGSGTGSATLYMSRFARAETADSLLNEMSEKIGEGADGFEHHQRFEEAGREIHMVLGQGQVHFFFARGEELIWLGIDPDLARPGLAEILALPESGESDDR
jgi:hypothetical protein